MFFTVASFVVTARALIHTFSPIIIITWSLSSSTTATPGRIVDHLENTRGFHLKTVKYLVMDEADRILNMDFEEEVDKLLAEIPKERSTYVVLVSSRPCSVLVGAL